MPVNKDTTLVLVASLHQATEDDVRQALEETAYYGFPQDEIDLLRFFNAMVEVLLGENPAQTETD